MFDNTNLALFPPMAWFQKEYDLFERD